MPVNGWLRLPSFLFCLKKKTFLGSRGGWLAVVCVSRLFLNSEHKSVMGASCEMGGNSHNQTSTLTLLSVRGKVMKSRIHFDGILTLRLNSV